MKGRSTFLAVNHISTSAEKAVQDLFVSLDSSAVIKALNELTAAVKAVKPEIRIDLPAMSPVVQAAAGPTVVNVPESPPIPAISVTVPDFPKPPNLLYPAYAILFFALFDSGLRLWEIFR